MTVRRIPIWSRVVLGVLLPILAYNIWDYVESRRLESRLTAIRERGEPTTPPYARPTREAAQAERFYRAASALVTYSEARPIVTGNQMRKAWLEGQWTPETLKAASVEVAENREALDFVDRAANLPFGGFLSGTSYNFQTGNLIRLGRLCELRAAVAASEGKGDAVLAAFFSLARLMRVFDMGLPLGALAPRFSGLSAAMAGITASAAAREEAARAFADIDLDDRLHRSLLQYRTAVLANPLAYFGSPFVATSTRVGAPGPLSSHVLVQVLDDFDRLLAASTEPWPQRIDAVKAIGAWPAWPTVFMSAADRDRVPKILAEFTTRTTEQVRNIRCARLFVSPTPLDLIDPFTGRRLEMLNCHL